MVYRFDTYRLDEENFSLMRDGERIALEPKALRLLLVLVVSQGRLMEKKVLLEAVWRDTFVEETTLTRAIAVIRKCLGDDPRAPRFIETIPTLGYRFVAPMEAVEREPVRPMPEAQPDNPTEIFLSPTVNPVLDPVSLLPPAVVAAEEKRAEVVSSATTSPHRLRWYLGRAALVAGTLVAIFLGPRLAHRTHPTLGARDTIILADFANTSGDPLFDDTLRQGMTVQLEQSPVLHLASEATIRKTLRLMGKPAGAALTPDLGREVCQRVGGVALLEGSISRAGSEYVLGLRARSCETGELLDVEQVQVERKENVLEALSRIAATFRTRVGESVASVNKFDTPLAEATTPSLDALRAFSQAIRLFNTSGSGQALPLFKRATELDPDFAMAHVWLGRMYADFGEETQSIKSTTRAYQLRERASDRERFSIDASYDLLVSGDLVKARETCEAWVHMYPADSFPHAFLSGIVYPAFGQYDKALAEADKTIELDPDFVVGYRNRILNSIALNRLQDAEDTLHQAAQRKLYLASFVTDRYRIAFLRGNTSAMQHALEEAPTNPWLMTYDALTRARSGDIASAREISARAVNISRQASRHDAQAQLEVAGALLEAFYGDPLDARRLALDALSVSRGKSTEFDVIYILAISGDSARAARLTDDLATRFPADTIVQYSYLPQLQALLALNHKQPRKALDLLKAATPYELSQPPHTIYLRGKALLALGQPTEAATEFHKILDHPGLVMNDPLSLLTRLELGRSYTQLGNTALAKAQYEDILNTLHGNDPSSTILREARVEYARFP